MVMDILKQELETGVHALSIQVIAGRDIREIISLKLFLGCFLFNLSTISTNWRNVFALVLNSL